MNTSRRSVIGAILAALAVAVPARAEVSAEMNAFGRYVRTVIYASASVRNPRIWTVSRARFGNVPLNPGGDAVGDLFPVVAEDASPQRWPWVVWSRYNGNDFDLVWSRWNGTQWSPIAPVDRARDAADAVDPSIAIGSDGPRLVWLSRGDGPAQVMLSIFLATQWMVPFPVSDPGEDAMNPTITLLPDGRMQVTYDTLAARVTKIVEFARPMTITDDLFPTGNVGATTTTTVPPVGGQK